MSEYDDAAEILDDECGGCGRPDHGCVCCPQCGNIDTLLPCPLCRGTGEYRSYFHDEED